MVQKLLECKEIELQCLATGSVRHSRMILSDCNRQIKVKETR